MINRLHGIGNRVDGDEEMLRDIWERFDQYGQYRAGRYRFSFREIDFLGQIFQESVEAEFAYCTSPASLGYIENATRSLLEVNNAFVAEGGMNNADLKARFEGFRQQVGLES